MRLTQKLSQPIRSEADVEQRSAQETISRRSGNLSGRPDLPIELQHLSDISSNRVGPQRYPATTPTVAGPQQLPQAASRASGSRSPPALDASGPGKSIRRDIRGNPVKATQSESSWGTHTWKELSPAHRSLIVQFVDEILETAVQCKTEYDFDNTFVYLNKPIQDYSSAIEACQIWRRDFSKSELSLAEVSVDLCQCVGSDTYGFRMIWDFIDKFNCVGNDELGDVARGRSFFRDRGRQDVPDSEVRSESAENTHAGIAEGIYRTPSTENFFNQTVPHSKSHMRGALNSETYKSFSQSGTPFINGVSGFMQQIAMHMELDGLYEEAPQPERDRRETIIVLLAAAMVACGNHGLMDAILPAKTYGYFPDVPEPLTGHGGYDRSIQALVAHLRKIGLPTERLIRTPPTRKVVSHN